MKVTGHYILNEHWEPVPCGDLFEWSDWRRANPDKWVVAPEAISKDIIVSTVFLGVDHCFDLAGPPVLWETMIFRSEEEQECWRCSGSREQAEAMHAEAVQHIKALLRPVVP